MDGEFDILLGGLSIGRATVKREGLYYRFDCRCQLSGEGVFRLRVRCRENTQRLGIPIPQDGEFVLRTRIPVKKLGTGVMTVEAEPVHEKMGEQFVPLSPEEPFRYLQRLEQAYLQTRNGQVGVVIPQQAAES